jgi:AbrB family looped-hinge helix DNA binding protein
LGQATIPKAIRERLGVKPGDRIKFFVHPDGSVVLLPKRPVSELRSIVVLAETAWVFERAYGLPDSDIAAAIGAKAGCPATLTFDQGALRLPDFQPPSEARARLANGLRQTGFRSINCRAMMRRCNSLVPSPISRNGASR